MVPDQPALGPARVLEPAVNPLAQSIPVSADPRLGDGTLEMHDEAIRPAIMHERATPRYSVTQRAVESQVIMPISMGRLPLHRSCGRSRQRRAWAARPDGRSARRGALLAAGERNIPICRRDCRVRASGPIVERAAADLNDIRRLDGALALRSRVTANMGSSRKNRKVLSDRRDARTWV
jgi:hypothetical protein